MTPPAARDLAVHVVPVSPDAACASVFDRLLSEPETRSIPIVRNGWPIGLISRKSFLLTYARMYGAELYGRRPVALLMERDILIVDGGTSCETINARARNAFGDMRMRPFVVTENGTYAGIGDAARLMMVMADLAAARSAALEEQTRRAEAASASKTQFLANMSHELRTPLNAIIGFADLMRLRTLGEVQPPRYREYIDDIHKSGVHLLNMINELLDMAKIESGHVELRETVFFPMDVGRDVLRMLRQSIAGADLQLRVALADGLPPIHADQQHIRRILINLLSNAIKYTPAGGTVTLSVCICGPNDGCGVEGMLLTVEDTGIGIPADKLEKVLEPFEQVENSFTRTRAGTGLGLALTKAMVEAHGGCLWLESELGKGTKAHALLPSARIMSEAPVQRSVGYRGVSPV
jgi:two-component system cell cycle sensor histidine kinase PleC